MTTETHLKSQLMVLAGLLREHVEVARTLEQEDSEDASALRGLIDRSEAAITAVLTEHAMGEA